MRVVGHNERDLVDSSVENGWEYHETTRIGMLAVRRRCVE
jgi:hypothetical protein